MSAAATIDELRDSLSNRETPEYRAKQLHAIPEAAVMNRENFIVTRCAGKVVLDIGASGPLHKGIMNVAAKCYGIIRPDWNVPNGSDLVRFNLDDVQQATVPQFEDVEIVIAGEVLEHLSNPGHFLDRLRAAYSCPAIFTVPNAFAELQPGYLARGLECVNLDHVAWYSPKTIKTLLGRHGYEIKAFMWYRGRPKFAEGMIVVTE